MNRSNGIHVGRIGCKHYLRLCILSLFQNSLDLSYFGSNHGSWMMCAYHIRSVELSGPLGIRTPDPWIKSLTSSREDPRKTPVLYLAELEAQRMFCETKPLLKPILSIRHVVLLFDDRVRKSGKFFRQKTDSPRNAAQVVGSAPA